METPFIPVWTRLRKAKKTNIDVWIQQAKEWLRIHDSLDEERNNAEGDVTTGPGPKVVGEMCSGPLTVDDLYHVLYEGEEQPLDPTDKQEREPVLAPNDTNQPRTAKGNKRAVQQPITKELIEQ